MPRYEQGTMGKLAIQDWEVITSYEDEPLLYILTRQQAASLLGMTDFLYWLTRWKNPPGQDEIDAFAAETEFNLMNPITCAMLQECLQPLFDAQLAEINGLINMSKYGDDVQPGEPMTEEERETDLAAGTNPTCDLDILCGQAGNLILYWIQTVLDILENAEAATNTAEFADVITQVTGLDELSADVITGYITFVQESINEGYAAAVTIEYQEAVQCSLWCKSKGDCEITPDDLYDVFRERVETTLGSPLPAFNSLIDLFQFFYGVPMDSTLIPDVMHLIMAGGGVLANVFMGDVGVKPLQILMAMWADEPDNNCSLICECPECGIPYEVTKGTEIDDVGTPAAEEFGVRPTGGGADAYFREIIYEFDEPVISAQFVFTWVGAHDGVFAQLGDGTVVQNTADDTGTLTATHPTGATTLIIVGGYAAEPLYAARYPEISEMDGCTA